jgi:hypothetical protein
VEDAELIEVGGGHMLRRAAASNQEAIETFLLVHPNHAVTTHGSSPARPWG